MEKISEWLKDSLRIYTDTKQAPGDFKQFFSDMRQLGLETKVKSEKDIRLEFNEAEETLDTTRLKPTSSTYTPPP